MSRRRSRRSHKAQVNYRETSESEGSQADSKHPRMKARRRMDSSDSEGQPLLQQGAPAGGLVPSGSSLKEQTRNKGLPMLAALA